MKKKSNLNAIIEQAFDHLPPVFGEDDKWKRHRFLIACSGGPDSQALLVAFPHVAKKLGYQIDTDIVAAGVNHGLRKEASQELELAAKTAESVGVPFFILNIKVEPGPNLMARARDARYAALRSLASGRVLVTAHHADDKAETVLIRLMRGGGEGALAVMPDFIGDVFRPMLRAYRSDVMAYLKTRKIEFAQDPSNDNERFLRVWLRKNIIPELKKRSPRIVENLVDVADGMIYRSCGESKWDSLVGLNEDEDQDESEVSRPTT